MALADAYATAEEYRIAIGRPDNGEDTLILEDLKAIARWLDQITGRPLLGFGKDAAPTTRRYYALSRRSRRLVVDEIATTTGLSVKLDRNRDGVAETTLTVNTDFQLYPLNAALAPEAMPYDELRLTEWSGISAFDGMVEVLATHGWPAPPRNIKAGNIQLCGILRLESPRATGQIPEDISAAVEASPEARRIVKELIKPFMPGPPVG